MHIYYLKIIRDEVVSNLEKHRILQHMSLQSQNGMDDGDGPEDDDEEEGEEGPTIDKSPLTSPQSAPIGTK